MPTRLTRRSFIPLVLAGAGAAPALHASSDSPRTNVTDAEGTPDLTMWFREPARNWTDALPVGNGRLGAMVYGATLKETITLNEDTLYSGHPKDGNNPEARKVLPLVRAAVLQRADYHQADKLCRKMQGPYCDAYQPMAAMEIETMVEGSVSGFRRQLDLDTATASVLFQSGGTTLRRECFVSVPDNVIVVRLVSSKPVTYRIRLNSQLQHSVAADAQGLLLSGKAPEVSRPNYVNDPDPMRYSDELGLGMYFAVNLRAATRHGTVTSEGEALLLSGVTEAMLVIGAATGFKSFDQVPDTPLAQVEQTAAQIVKNAAGPYSYPALWQRHLAAHRECFRRVNLDLGRLDPTRSTDELLRAYADNPNPALAALYFQFGRYLLISSSRPGTQPANLQGIWSADLRPPWSFNWTSNINLQMNYWLAESCNLPEFHLPLFEMLRRLSRNGATTAEVNYGAPGWVSHHNIDIWCISHPVGEGTGDPTWANFAMSAPWLCAHLWEHYRFTMDEAFLRTVGYPLMRGAAEFCSAWLIDNNVGRLTTCPSVSTENNFLAPDGRPAEVSAGCTLDLALVRELFGNCMQASHILGVDQAFAQQLQTQLERLQPYQIGRYGQLQEWSVDFKECTPGQRHMSQLYPLFPGSEFSPQTTPVWAHACRVSLERRLQAGGAYTGWSRAWATNLWARLQDGAQAAESLRLHFKLSTGGNFFDTHPAASGDIFQIDGNFGTSAAIAEMLLQSHTDEIRLLPALPPDWKAGSVEGLRARGNITVGMRWDQGNLQHVTLKVEQTGTYRIGLPGQKIGTPAVTVHGLKAKFTQTAQGLNLVCDRPGTYRVRFRSS